jgi:hypothetical protein
MHGRRRVATSGGGFTGLVDKVLYAITAVLVVCSVSLAGQGMFFERVRTVDDEGAQSPPPATSKPRAPRAAWSGQVGEDEGFDDLSGVVPRPRTLPRNPSTAGPDRPAADAATASSQPKDAAGAQARPAPASGPWNVMSALGNLLPLGSGSSAGAAAKPTSDPPRVDAPASRPSGGAQLAAISFSTDEGSACQAGPLEFQLTDVPDLHVCVALKGLSGKYAEKLTFLLPDGNVYQTMTIPFMTADMPASTDPKIEVDGLMYRAERAGWGANGVTLVTARLPVAGTFITQHTLAGVWTVQVGLDGNQVGREYFEFLTP